MNDDVGGSGHRRPLTVVNNSPDPLPAGYTIRVGLGDLLGESSLAGVRVLEDAWPSNAPGLDRILDLDPPGEDTALWFALAEPIAPDSEAQYWLFYDTAGMAPAPPADAKNVFLLYDDFTAASLDSVWASIGDVTPGAGLYLGAGDSAITTDPIEDRVVPMSVFEAEMAVTNPNATGTYYWIGYQHTGDFGTGGPFLDWVGEPGTIFPWVQIPSQQSTRCATIAQDDALHRYRVERLPTAAQYYLDGVFSCELEVADATDYSIQLRNQSPSNEMRIQWVRVRERATPEPTVIVGAKQSY